ncbi:CHAT domain-containing protein [Thermobispora bispora]|nr:CHAT domain-containing protein [Thermobispora bispora]
MSAPPPAASHAARLVARAEAAVRLSGRDPGRALAEAAAVLAEGRATGGAGAGPAGEAISVALRASALAARELGDLHLAARRLHQAVAAARRHPRRAAQALMSLVTVRAQLGDPQGALRLADRAERDLAADDRARLDVQRSVALILLGRHRDAVRHCDRAVPALRGDPRFLAGALLNRGLARAYLEEYGAAERDLSACAAIARAAGMEHVAVLAESNLPFLAARRGDIPAAFESYAAVEGSLRGYPERLATTRTDFAEALIAARLPGEAHALLDRALADLAASGSHASIPYARLLLAQAELLLGDARRAQATAGIARSELERQGRTAWTPLATEVILRARMAMGPPDTGLLAALLSCAADLAAHGWPAASCALRLRAAEAAVRLGRPATAGAQLDLVIARSARPEIRQHALAMRRRLAGDLPGALEAARAGLEARPPRPVPAALRVHAARPADDLAAFGLATALETGEPWTVLTWAERRRAAVRGTPAPSAFGPGHLAGVRGTLIELVRDEDELFAVVVTARECLLRSLGPYAEAAEAAARIRYGLRRRNLRDCGEPAGGGPAGDGLAGELAALDGRVFGALGAPVPPVVIVPTGALCTLPWPLLPSLAGRPVTVAAEGTSWLTGAPGPGPLPGGPMVVAVAGPGLRHAAAEADAVVRAHRAAKRVGAVKRELLGALGYADVLHVAAHGAGSPARPMHAEILLEDGPLMSYELREAERMPRLVVLSACETGMAHAPVDGAAPGLAGAFLDQGAGCVVAGVVPVRDGEAFALMTVFHAELAEGRTPAEALAVAAERTGVPGFVCFGAGHRRLFPPA